MLKKLKLDQTKTYEKYLALEEISKMIVSFTKGIPYNFAIGAEQGGIDKWDDLVIQTNNGGYIYIQAKRQTTPFSSDNIDRDKYIQGPRKGQFKDLSPLDETFRSLGKRVCNHVNCSNEFWLELPDSSIEIKKGLEVRDLRRLKDQIKSVTTQDGLVCLDRSDSNTHNIYRWLTTWCDFSGWDHILKAFRILKLKASGFEEDIECRVNTNLSEIFKTTEIDKIRMLILFI